MSKDTIFKGFTKSTKAWKMYWFCGNVNFMQERRAMIKHLLHKERILPTRRSERKDVKSKVVLDTTFFHLYSHEAKFDFGSRLYAYTTNDKHAIEHCEIETWMYAIDGGMLKASNCQQLRKNLHPMELFSVLYGYNKQTHTLFIQRNTLICIVRHQGNPILILRSSYGAEDDLSCELKLHLSHGLYLDMHLFTDWSALHKQLSLDNMRDAGVYHWPAICDSLSASALIGDFSVVSGVLQGGRDLLYWLDACGVQMPVGYLRDQTLRDVSDNDTHCVLQRVSGLESTSSPAEKLSVSEMYCVEDMMSYLRPLGRNLVYSSPLGVSAFSTSHDASFEMSHVVELIHVIRAFMNLDFSNKVAGNQFVTPVHALEVKSMWRPYLESMRSNDADIRRSVLLLVSSQDSAQWEVAMHSLRNKTDHWLSDSPELRRRTVLEIINALMTYAVNHDGVVCLSSARNRRTSLLCGEDSMARQSLVTYLQDHVSIGCTDATENVCSETDENIVSVLNALKLSLRQRSTASRDVAALFNRSPQALDAMPPTLVSNSILMFVTSEDVLAARNVVQGWRQQCPHCPIVNTYSVIPITRDEGGLSFRTALRLVDEYLSTFSVKRDLCVVLIGLDAIRAYRPPGDKNSLSPYVAVADASPEGFRLPHPLLFAVHPACSQNLYSAECDVMLTAFSGAAANVRDMIRSVLTRRTAYFTAASLRHAMKRYLIGHPDEVGIDVPRRFFDFNPNTQNFPIQTLPATDVNFADLQSILDSSEARQSITKLYETVFRYMAQSRLYEYTILVVNSWMRIKSDLWIPKMAENFMEVARKLKYYSPSIPLEDKIQVISLLETQYDNLLSMAVAQDPTWKDAAVMGITSLLDALHFELGNTVGAAQWFQRSLTAPHYRIVFEHRRIWHQQRLQLHRNSNDHIVTHYYTVASEMTDGLQNLLFSARLAGIDLQVLGLGQEYRDYSQKIEWFIESIISNSEIDANDVIVLMDAYDVVVSAPIRNIAEHLAHAPTPIVYCAENGVYPDASSPWFYYRGGDASSYVDDAGQGVPRFLNSGCVMGRAQQIKELLLAIWNDMKVALDDQQTIVRHMLEHPHIISLDIYKQSFHCGYKEPPSSLYAISASLGIYFTTTPYPVALFHANNRQSFALYTTVLLTFVQVFELYYSGNDGTVLLEAAHAIWDGELELAKQLLRSDVVLGNATAHGGVNKLSELLWNEIDNMNVD